MAQSKSKYILSDLDGVIRHYPPEHSQAIEKEFKIPAGTLLSNNRKFTACSLKLVY